MSLPLVVNGTSYDYPLPGETGWGAQASLWASAVTTGMLQKAGGTFTLTADADFGATYGLKASKFATRSSNPSTTGVLRLSNNEGIGWRNAANNADLLLKVNASDLLEYNGTTISLNSNSGVSAGSYGSATQVGTFTVDAVGRLSAASNTTIQITESQVTNLVTDLGTITTNISTINSTLASTPSWTTVPTSPTDPGVAGQLAYDSGSLYVCIATNSWKRTSLTGV